MTGIILKVLIFKIFIVFKKSDDQDGSCFKKSFGESRIHFGNLKYLTQTP